MKKATTTATTGATPAAKKTATKKAAPAAKPAAPAVKKAKPAAKTATVIRANVDVGFGNTLYIRGEGPGLSWDRGLPMDCVKDDLWSYTVDAAARPVVFKFLINDETWCAGDDYIAAPGETVTLVPSF